MKRSKKVIGYILIVSGLIRIILKRDIIYRLFVENGTSDLPFDQLFIPVLLAALGVTFLMLAYKRKNHAKINKTNEVH